MLRYSCIVLGLALISHAPADRLDDVIRIQMRRQRIPGLAVAVIRQGKLVTARGYGIANVEAKTKVTPNTAFRIGSVSKQFVAAAAMLLVQDGKLDLDAPISRYMKVPPLWEPMTMRQLLTHTSGLVRDQPGFSPFTVAALDTEIEKAVASPLRFEPGKGWGYSNVGYYVVAKIVEAISAMPWDSFVAKRIFTPLGMSRTTTARPERIVADRAAGYTFEKDEIQNAQVWRAIRPSGAYFSTVMDFVRWDDALTNVRLLSRASLEQSWKPVDSKHLYGFAWFVDALRGHRRVHHNGGVPGYQADFQRLIDDQVSVVIMINSDKADVERISENVLGVYVPGAGPPEYRKVEGVEPAKVEVVRRLFASLKEPQPDRTLLTPRLLGILEKDWSGANPLFTSLGTLRSVEPVELRSGGDPRKVRFRLTFKERSFLVVVTFEGDRIDEYDLEEE